MHSWIKLAPPAWHSVIVFAAILGVLPPHAGAAPASEPPATQPVRQDGTGVPVKSVVLYSSGVGYFEHFGTVKGSGTTELRFKTRQINDILKSLVLQDLDGGKVTAISYPSQDPIEKTLKSFQVDITRNPSLGDLLNQLRGAKVKVFIGEQTVTGTVLGVETKSKLVVPAADPAAGAREVAETSVLNLFTGMGVRAVKLDSVTNIDFDDPQLRAELGKALGALSESRDQDKKPVTISFTGDQERRVRLAYLVETPIWKTSYRLILTEEDNAKPRANLQGWAIVENQTDNDWTNVQLSLVSGRPISFIQDLYQPLYVPRPVMKPKLFASLRPQTYEGGITEEQQKLRAAAEAKENEEMADPILAAKRDVRRDGKGVGGGGGGGGGLFGGAGGGEAEAPFDPTASISAMASAKKLGELFQYTVGNVSLPRQRSAMIPIITDPLEVERLSIYNPAVLQHNPLYGARIKNTTKKHLLAGPIAVTDAGTYAGDASIEDLPPGQERFISYGVDLEVLVDEPELKSVSTIQSGRIISGMLLTNMKSVLKHEYAAENKGEKKKTLIIEHAFQPGWDLLETAKPFEKTADTYRFKLELPPGKVSKLVVVEQTVTSEKLALLSAEEPQYQYYIRDGAIPKGVKDALATLVWMKSAIVETQQEMAAVQKQVAEITTEQTRIRENMKTVNQQQSEYYTRLLKKLNDQENEIEKLQAQSAELKTKMDMQRKDLEKYISDLEVG